MSIAGSAVARLCISTTGALNSANVAGMSSILDAHTVLVGMQPAIAITLVELGLDLPGVKTALNVERGMAGLARSLAEERSAYSAD